VLHIRNQCGIRHFNDRLPFMPREAE
jgi:hypothetical protein